MLSAVVVVIGSSDPEWRAVRLLAACPPRVIEARVVSLATRSVALSDAWGPAVESSARARPCHAMPCHAMRATRLLPVIKHGSWMSVALWGERAPHVDDSATAPALH